MQQKILIIFDKYEKLNVSDPYIHCNHNVNRICQLKFNMCFPIIVIKIRNKIFVSALAPTLMKVDVNATIIRPKSSKK